MSKQKETRFCLPSVRMMEKSLSVSNPSYKRKSMNMILKRVLIAAGLIVFCGAVFAGVKSYGVWVITGVAVVLFIVGILRKEKPTGPGGCDETQDRDREG